MRLAAPVLALIWLAVSAAASFPASQLSLSLATTGELSSESPSTAQLELRISGAQPEPLVLEEQVEVPGTLSVPVPPGSVVEAQVTAPGLWAPKMSVYVGEEPESLSIELFPTGLLVAPVITESGPPPESLEARFAWAPDAEAGVPGEHTAECPIVEKRLACELPGGTLDLRLRRRGLVTLFRWGVAIPPREELESPPLHLRPGSTVFGWLAGTAEGLKPETARAELAPGTVTPSRDSADRQRGESMRLEAKVNARGFYVFPDAPAGSYELVLRHEGFAPGRLDPVVVREGIELELPPVELSPPSDLTLSVWPPRDPFHQAWRIDLDRTGPLSSRTVAEGNSDLEGRFHAGDLEPGEHRLTVIDSRGSRWHSEKVEVTGPGTVHRVEMPYDRLEGLVTLAGEPLPSTVYFGGRSGSERVVIDTNEEGIFYVFLPRRESWFADVYSGRLDLLARIDGIVVERQAGEPWAKTEIEVPDTRVFGEVVDGEGRPLGGAQVQVYGPEPEEERGQESRRVNADPDGRFELHGSQAGLWGLEARYWGGPKGPFASAPLTEVEVEEGSPTGPVRLVAREDHILSGLVVAPNGDGVPGALVVPGLEQGASPVSWDIQHEVTEVDGTFRFRIPSGVPAVQLQVYPPGHAARHFRILLPAEDPVIVPVDAVGGTIVLRPSDPEALTDRSFHFKTALFGEFLYYTPALRLWAGSWGIRETDNLLVVPSIEPGPYTACFDVTSLSIATGRLPAGVEARCVSGTLAPGGELTLEVPVPRPPEPEDQGAR